MNQTVTIKRDDLDYLLELARERSRLWLAAARGDLDSELACFREASPRDCRQTAANIDALIVRAGGIPGEVFEKAQTLGSEALDELVHDAKSSEAAAINNDGVDSQLEYLREVHGPHELPELLDKLLAETREDGA